MWMAGMLVGVGCAGHEVEWSLVIGGGALSLFGVLYVRRFADDG